MNKALLVAFLLFGQTLAAQSNSELWTKVHVTKSITGKISLGVDVQHRRQNDSSSLFPNLFRHSRLNSTRLWVYYQLHPNWKLVLSPVGFFVHTAKLESPIPMHRTHELRTSIGVERTILFNNVTSTFRLLNELRLLSTHMGEKSTQYRSRLRGGIIVPMGKFNKKTRFNYSLINEMIIASQQRNMRFDQNRLTNGIQWQWHQQRLTTGYQLTFLSPKRKYIRKNQLVMTYSLVL